MARQTHTPLSAVGTWALDYIVEAADLTMTAADATNLEQLVLTGDELIIAHNTGGSARTVTISSPLDPYGRIQDISYSLGAGEYAAFGPLALREWMWSSGKLVFGATHADVKFGVIRWDQARGVFGFLELESGGYLLTEAGDLIAV